MWSLIALTGMAVWMVLALVVGLALGAMVRLRDRCGMPEGTLAKGIQADVDRLTASATR